MTMPIFHHAHPRIIDITFSFPEFAPAYNNHLEIQSILESHGQTGRAHFWPCPLQNFWLTFSLRKFVSTCKESGYVIDEFWRYGWLKNPAIWLGEGILAHISRTKIFPNMRFVQEHSKQYKFSL